MPLKKYFSKNILFILILYVIVTFIFELFYFKYGGKLYAGDDLLFHYSRLMELLQSKNYNFPVIATHLFGGTGNQVNVFYPVQFVYPLMLLIKHFAHPVLMIYFYFGLFNFFTLILAHYAAYRLGKPVRFCLVFSVLYVFSFYRLLNFFKRADWGEFFAATFIPLVFVGMYLITQQKGGRTLLVVGMCGLIFSHMLSVLLVSIFLLVWFLFCIYHSVMRERIIRSLLQSALMTLGVSFIFWFPFVVHYLKVPSGFKTTVISFNVIKPVKWSVQLSSFLHNRMYYSSHLPNTVATIGTFALILLVAIMIFFIQNYRLVNKASWLILGLTLICLWLTTPLFPWKIFKGTAVNIIQFPFRFNAFASLGISWCAAQLGEMIKSPKIKFLWTFSLICLTCIFAYNSVNQLMKLPPQKNVPALSNANFYNYRSELPATNDYFPKQAQKYIGSIPYHIIILNGKEAIASGNPGNNESTYTIHSEKKHNIIDLPFLCYSDNYRLTNWGKPLAYHFSQRGTFLVRTDTRVSKIKIEYQPTFIDRYSGWISVISIVFFIFLLMFKQRFER
ncbi:hypothetical protein GYU96_03630 [Lactobacillus mellis]|uniref:hypothetical protein n=1 Tax=Bombilactobacillus mellis TaxID=1218508 RepID=UPI0015803AEF|nr:hypothetical protein [Bombilactobacillus mellis]NUG66944.1 hypothetical protein [Bombilactobacillus mellis]